MATPTELQQLYLAYFGRPAEPGSIAFYANVPVATVLVGFSASPESQALYGASFSTASVKAIYTYLFNRTAADSEAAFWVGVVNAPHSTVSPAAAALTILQSAHNDDYIGISNKLQLASIYTSLASNYSGSAAAAAARSLLATVNTNFSSVTDAANKVNGGTVIKPPTPLVPLVPTLPTSNYFYLTAGVDNIHGGTGDDFISGALGGLYGTFAAGDTIDGGAGSNTLALTVNDATSSLAGVQITNVQKLYAASAGGGNVSLDAQSVSGLTELDTAGSPLSVTFANPVNVVLNNSQYNPYSPYGNSSNVTNVYTANAALAGNADASTLTLTGSAYALIRIAAATPTANEYETLTIVSNAPQYASGAVNAFTLATDATQTSLTTLNISGATPLVLQLAADHITTSATSINASGTSGGVTVGTESGVTLGAASHHIVLGSGNDTVFFGANLDGNDSVDGGAGTDTIGVSAAVSSMASVHNVEVLRFDLSGQSIVQDASVAGMAGLSYTMSGSNSLTLNNVANNATMTMTSSIAGLSASLQNPGGSNDSLTVVMGTPTYSGPLSLGVLSGFSGVEHLNFVANVGGTYSGGTSSINSINSSAPLFFSGNGTLKVNSALQTQTVDASAMTGNLNTTLGTSATTYRGGSGIDTILIGLGSDGHTVGHTISLGAGSDNIVFTNEDTAGNGGATSLAGLPVITDFSAGQDKLGMYYYNSSYQLGYSIHPAGTSGMQSVAQNGTASLGNYYDAVMVKLSTAVAFNGTIAGTFAAAMGTGSVGHTGGNYLAMVYDTTHSKAIVAMVSSYTAGTADLTAADFTSTSVSVLGVLSMNTLDYAALSGANFSGNMYT